jgi:hypothetical protein
VTSHHAERDDYNEAEDTTGRPVDRMRLRLAPVLSILNSMY